MSDRAGIFGDDGQDFDISDFTPKKPKDAEPKIPIETVRAVSEAANFPSREPVTAQPPPPSSAPVTPQPPAPPEMPEASAAAAEIPPEASPEATGGKREKRRHRTGRNVQLNIKVKSETVDAFYALADEQGWVLGETLERAIEALKASLKGKK